MTRNQEKEVRSKLTKWLAGKTSDSFILESRVSGWVDYFRDIPSPVTCLAACSWLCSGAVVLPEDMPKVEQAVKVARLNRVDPLRYGRPMDIIETFAAAEVKEHPIDPDSVPTLHLNRKFDSGLAIYDVDESQESRENMRRIINTHFGKESSPWCLLQGDGNGNLTEDSAACWERYSAYPKQVAFVCGRLAAFSADMDIKDMPWWDLDENAVIPSEENRTWWDRMDDCSDTIVYAGKIKGDHTGIRVKMEFDASTGILRSFDDHTLSRLGRLGLSTEETETLRRTCDIVFLSQAGPIPLSCRGGDVFVGVKKMPLGQAMHELKKNPKFIDSLVPAQHKPAGRQPFRHPDKPYQAHIQTVR